MDPQHTTATKKEEKGSAKDRKKYRTVSEMVKAISEDEGVAEGIAKSIAARNIISALMTKRTALGMSQKDIADVMKCTQSRISKLENGEDDDLRIGDFHGYADALGLQLMIILAPKKRTIVDEIRFHSQALKRLFNDLAGLAGNDGGMAKAILSHLAQATMWLSTAIKEAAQKLPLAKKETSSIQIEMPVIEQEKPEECCSERALCGAAIG